MEILNEKIITAAEARKILEKRDTEAMTYEQKICIDFMRRNVNLSGEDAVKMVEELKELNVPEDISAIIANTLPKTDEELKNIFPKERMAPSSEELEKISEIVRKYE